MEPITRSPRYRTESLITKHISAPSTVPSTSSLTGLTEIVTGDLALVKHLIIGTEDVWAVTFFYRTFALHTRFTPN